MSGNATEEGLLGQIHNPSHLDPGRIAVPFAALFAILAGIGLRLSFSEFGIGLPLLVGLVVYFTLYTVLMRWLLRRKQREDARAMQARRQNQHDETERQIALMKKR